MFCITKYIVIHFLKRVNYTTYLTLGGALLQLSIKNIPSIKYTIGIYNFAFTY